jgi:lysophospholipase L1-like esterase
MNQWHILFLILLPIYAFPQDNSFTQWWDPVKNEFPVIEGQAWGEEVEEPYDRLPERTKSDVAKDVWGNSKQSAGLMIRFRTNSPNIIIRYGVMKKGSFAMNHMPATGVSGVDLYAIDSDGREIWCAGRRSFSDTVIYRFQELTPNDPYHQFGREYRLYLPLYNQLNWLEIGVEESAYFKPLPIRKEKPIVVYGTSIAHGGCASRPGMAWTAILGRNMDRPLINLGFSGSGRLERPVLELIAEIDAKLYILDCLPNLPKNSWERLGITTDEVFMNRVLEAVRYLKSKKPDIPILLVDHAGYSEQFINKSRKESFSHVNQLQKEVYYQLRKEGYGKLFYLTYDEIGMSLDGTVDGTHPNDLGMMNYADAYTKKLRSIFREPIGKYSTTQPVTQYREPHNYDWEDRHWEIMQMNATTPPRIVILANSIIHFWGGLPRTKLVREEETWETIFTPSGIRNYAYGWDRIENVLWRVYHGELDGFEAEKVVVMIGTNNLLLNTDDEILEGLHLLIEVIKDRQPGSEIVLMGILPRRDYEGRIANLNLQISLLAEDLRVVYDDVGAVFLDDEYKFRESLFSDGLHPNETGYLKLREALKPFMGIE